jgi:hypothetical protein
MPPHPSPPALARPLRRTFCGSRLSREALSQSYERLLPVARRPLAGVAPASTAARLFSSRRACG